MSTSDFQLKEVAPTQVPKIKPKPKSASIKVPFEYSSSDTGTDENLLILLHGLGDTHVPFTRLARRLNLPQTATLTIQAPEQIPFLDEKGFQWYTSFDPLGELIDRPNPTPALDLLSAILKHLTEDCQWPPDRIHLFGFAQGGSVAVEVALKWWREQLANSHSEQRKGSTELPEASAIEVMPKALASIVTVSGPLLSYPTTPSDSLCPTPILAIHRPPPSESSFPAGAIVAFRKGFRNFTDTSIGPGEGMPRSKEEWEPIMRFWSERLSRRMGEGLYEIMTGTASA